MPRYEYKTQTGKLDILWADTREEMEEVLMTIFPGAEITQELPEPKVEKVCNKPVVIPNIPNKESLIANNVLAREERHYVSPLSVVPDKFYSINGTDFKLANGIMYIKEWKDAEGSDIRVVSRDDEGVDKVKQFRGTTVFQVLEWVEHEETM